MSCVGSIGAGVKQTISITSATMAHPTRIHVVTSMRPVAQEGSTYIV